MKFEAYAPEGNRFVKEVAEALGNVEDTDYAYRIMRSVFHTIRDILTPQESMHMVAQLPLVIKGVYVNEWHLRDKIKVRSMDDFLQSLRAKNESFAASDFGDDETAIHHTRCVLNVLKRHVNTGEVQHLIDQFPLELAGLWLPEENAVQH